MTATITRATARWTLHDDRALPADPVTRPIAREVYAATRELPILSMHGHVPAEWFADDTGFGDPAQLLIVPDHYLLRMLVSQGATLPELGVGSLDGSASAETHPRAIWRRFCAGWQHFRGTPTRFWMESALVDIFGVTVRPSPETADEIYEQIQAAIDHPSFRPQALLDRFDIEVIATTDPAWASLEHHRALAEQGYGERIVPTFRPDPVFTLDSPSFAGDVERTGAAAGVAVTSYASYLDALRAQRLRFKAAGGRATDHGPYLADTTPLSAGEAARLFDKAMRSSADRSVSAAEATAFSAHMLFQTAAMAAEDHLVMQLHPGVERGHAKGMTATFGADKGYDIPVAVEYTRALRPMLDAFGHHPGFRFVAFTIDEDVYSRELAPMAGVYPAMRLGAPWWFLDSPEAMRRFRESATETAGFSNMAGFVDDTRAFCSIPARHDLARRIDAGYLARLVAEHRLEEDEALETAIDLAYHLPRSAYRRP